MMMMIDTLIQYTHHDIRLDDNLFHFSGKIMFESGVWMSVEGEVKKKDF